MSKDEFEFQIGETEIRTVDDSKSWGLVPEFVVEHARVFGCARPEYMRVTIGYSSRAMEALGTDTPLGQFVTGVYRHLPFLIGSKALMCTKCQNLVFVSKAVGWLWMHLGFLRGSDNVKLLVFEGDACNIPHEKKKEFYEG